METRAVLAVVAVVSAVFAAQAAARSIDPPDWKQCDPSWADVHRGNSSKTICDQGNTETCIAMLLASRGYKGNPGTLVEWLSNNDGYHCFAGSDLCLLVDSKTDELGFSKYYGLWDNKGYSVCYQVCAYIEKGYGILAWDNHNFLITSCNAEAKQFNVRDPTGNQTTLMFSQPCQFELFE